MRKIVDVKNLKVSFPSSKNKKNKVQVIRGVDFEIFKGQVVAFIGESGSGKSVTAKTLLGINNNAISTANKIQVGDVDLLTIKNALTTKKNMWKKIRGKKIAYIPQDSLASLNPTKRIGKQITEVLKIHAPEYKTAKARKEYAIYLLEKFGIKNAKEKLRAFPHEFSGGMRQRVVITIMVACKPDVIIADEPTTALDPTIENEIIDILKEIVKTRKLSVIIITHDFSVIASLAKKIAVMYAGKVIEYGTTDEVINFAQHPYTWGLLRSIPDGKIKENFYSIPGRAPFNLDNIIGDAFAPRNIDYLLEKDLKEHPPFFKISKTHIVASWLLDKRAPAYKPPKEIENRWKDFISRNKLSATKIPGTSHFIKAGGGKICRKI